MADPLTPTEHCERFGFYPLLEPVTLTAKTIPFPVPIAPEYAECLAAMSRVRAAVVADFHDSVSRAIDVMMSRREEPEADTPVEVRS